MLSDTKNIVKLTSHEITTVAFDGVQSTLVDAGLGRHISTLTFGQIQTYQQVSPQFADEQRCTIIVY